MAKDKKTTNKLLKAVDRVLGRKRVKKPYEPDNVGIVKNEKLVIKHFLESQNFQAFARVLAAYEKGTHAVPLNGLEEAHVALFMDEKKLGPAAILLERMLVQAAMNGITPVIEAVKALENSEESESFSVFTDLVQVFLGKDGMKAVGAYSAKEKKALMHQLYEIGQLKREGPSAH